MKRLVFAERSFGSDVCWWSILVETMRPFAYTAESYMPQKFSVVWDFEGTVRPAIFHP